MNIEKQKYQLSHQSLIAQLTKILYKVSNILVRKFIDNLSNSETQNNQLLANIDEEIENILLREIQRFSPEISILFEGYKKIEGQDPENKRLLIIDPIDGTANFSSNIKDCGISIALQEDGETVLGLIMLPMQNELFIAQKNQHSYLLNDNQNRIRVKASKRIIRSNNFLMTRTSMFLNGPNLKILHYFAKQKFHIRCSGCVSMDLAYLACGRANLVIFDRTKIWDIAAGELIAQEAGAIIKKIDNYFIASSSLRMIDETEQLINRFTAKNNPDNQ